MPLDTEDISFRPKSAARESIARTCLVEPLLLDDGLFYLSKEVGFLWDLVRSLDARLREVEKA